MRIDWRNDDTLIAFSKPRGHVRDDGTKDPSIYMWDGWCNLNVNCVQPDHNVFLGLCGAKNNITVIDIDPALNDPTPNKCFEALCAKYPAILNTQIELSRRKGGYHLYFIYEPKLATRTKFIDNSVFGADIDVLNDEHLIIGAPTILTDGAKYSHYNDNEVQKIPDDLLEDLLHIQAQFTTPSNPYGTPKTKTKLKIKVNEGANNAIIADMDWEMELVDLIDVSYLSSPNYRDWFNIICAIKAHSKVNPNFTKAYARTISLRGAGFKERDWGTNGVWEKAEYGSFGTLVNYAKNSNKKATLELYKKKKLKTIKRANMTELRVALYYIELFGEKIKVSSDTGINGGKLYMCSCDIWTEINKDEVISYAITNELLPHFEECLDVLYDEMQPLKAQLAEMPVDNNGKLIKSPELVRLLNAIDPLETLIKNTEEWVDKMQKTSALKSLTSMVKTQLCGRMMEEGITFNNQPDLLHFKNGVLVLSKLDKTYDEYFRRRRPDDYTTYHLPYDYDDVADADAVSNIKNAIAKMHTDSDMLEFMLSWIAYNMTGYTHLQYFIANIGYGASNGKSTLYSWLTDCFGHYVDKAPGSMWEANNQHLHKIMATLTSRPTRVVLMEEFGNKKLNYAFAKEIVDGGLVKYPEMYGTTCTKHINFKINLNSNEDLDSQDTDNGFQRRVLYAMWSSQFLRVNTQGNFITAKGVDTGVKAEDNVERRMFKQDKSLGDQFKKDKYKNAFVHMLKPYWTNFYAKDLQIDIPNKVREGYNKTIDECDEVQIYINDYVIDTADEKYKLGKDALIEAINNYTGKTYDLKRVQKKMKQAGYATNYDSQKWGYKSDKRGCYVGLKIKPHTTFKGDDAPDNDASEAEDDVEEEPDMI